jgi:hypothetical protein
VTHILALLQIIAACREDPAQLKSTVAMLHAAYEQVIIPVLAAQLPVSAPWLAALLIVRHMAVVSATASRPAGSRGAVVHAEALPCSADRQV